jgi:putative transposase
MGDRSGRLRRPSADALEGNLRRVGTTSPDEVRVKLVRGGIGVLEAARTLGISRKTAYKWLDRHDREGVAGLSDRSRARHTQEHATPRWLRDVLVELRRQTRSGPRQLLFLIHRERPEWRLQSVSTVSSILRQEGLVEAKRPRRRDPDLRGPTGPYRPGKSPDEQWTVDFKGHFRLGDRSVCYPLTVQVDASRYLLCVDGHGSTSTLAVLSSFGRLFRRRGLPERIHGDNGSPFAGTGVARLSQVSPHSVGRGCARGSKSAVHGSAIRRTTRVTSGCTGR